MITSSSDIYPTRRLGVGCTFVSLLQSQANLKSTHSSLEPWRASAVVAVGAAWQKMKDAKSSNADGIGDAVLRFDNVDKTQNGFELEEKERQRAEKARRREEEEEQAQQREIEVKAKAAREAAEARRQEQERAEQECAAKVAGKGKLDAWMKTKEKW